MEIFERDDDGYKQWCKEHPDGWVLNVYTNGRTHRPSCPHIRPESSEGLRLTHSRSKACSESLRELEQLRRREWHPRMALRGLLR